MKKFISLLLSLCLLLGTLPLQVSAFAGDIFPSESTVKTVTLNDGSLSLQNEYIHKHLPPVFWHEKRGSTFQSSPRGKFLLSPP